MKSTDHRPQYITCSVTHNSRSSPVNRPSYDTVGCKLSTGHRGSKFPTCQQLAPSIQLPIHSVDSLCMRHQTLACNVACDHNACQDYEQRCMQVGASTAAHAKVAWKYDKRTTLHASTRVNAGGYQLGYQVEAGGRYRWSHNTSTGLGVAYGSQVRLISHSLDGAMSAATLSAGSRCMVPLVLCWSSCSAFAIPAAAYISNSLARGLPLGSQGHTCVTLGGPRRMRHVQTHLRSFNAPATLHDTCK